MKVEILAKEQFILEVCKFVLRFKLNQLFAFSYQRAHFAYFCKMVKIGNIELPDFPFLLAPMEDVSDPPFRRLCKLHGADLMYSEFISSEGLIRDAMKSRKNSIFLITKDLLEFRFLVATKKQWQCLPKL
jgi:hypothetical protein